MKRLLIVDDDVRFARELKDALERSDCFVDVVTSGADCLRALQLAKFDFILLDWNLDDITGVEVCRRFRESGGKTPIIFLTGRSEITDKETGLDAGGDDYLTKPFDVRELMARLRSVERRVVNFERESFSFNGLELNPALRMATYEGRKVSLSNMETDVLMLLMQNRDRYLSASEIYSLLWPEGSGSHDIVRSHIKLLRRRLSKIGAEDLVETKAGVGYILTSAERDQ